MQTLESLEPDPCTASVAAQLSERAARGLSKYGCSVADNPLPLPKWLQHLQEELLDAAVYVERLKQESRKRDELQSQLDAALAQAGRDAVEVTELRLERDEAIESKEHTQQFYAVRLERLKDYFRDECNGIPKDTFYEFFSIVANACKNPQDPPSYMQMLQSHRYKAGVAERERETITALALRMAAHIANADRMHGGTWGVRGHRLMMELQDMNPERYNSYMQERELVGELKDARGDKFTQVFRQLDATLGERLRNELISKREREGSVPIRFIGEMAHREGIAVKTLCRMLEDGKALPSGWYEQACSKGIKPTQLLEAAKELERALELAGEGDEKR